MPEFDAPAPTSHGHLAPDRSTAENLARMLRALADPTRIQLLALMNGAGPEGTTVKELTDALTFRQPTISHHLRILLDEGIVCKSQTGRQTWYSIAAEHAGSISDLLR
ncbi:hypothetical protein GCM10010977_29340 [Citricoccus zhacaiensis]|nr:hypothetical protein GCM10010977_29340 [Citricoccus zhacaiensis]VXC15707.1 ArsR family transcriptional regulator [Citricoccus sp. K5]